MDAGGQSMSSTSTSHFQSTKDHTTTVAKHYNELQECGLATRTKSRIFYLRNFNNWIKSVLIGETLKKIRNENPHAAVSVLDLCSGKGGDLLKWKKGKIDKLVCADIAGTSVEQSEARYKEMIERNNKERWPQKVFSAEFITADCTKQRLKNLYKDPQIEFDLVSCQFSFHYCFESYLQADMMLRNISECLKPGGYFIGTTPNSNELVQRLRNSPDNTFKNEVYKVIFESENKDSFPLFGAKYFFHLEGVVDCPEFLVHFPLLENMAEKHGLNLVCTKTFSDYFKKNAGKEEARCLLLKMQALEPYPPDEHGSLMSSNQESYSHAKDFLKDQQDRESLSESHGRRWKRKIGTISKPEWEATTIYMTFVFQKKKDQPPSIPKCVRHHPDKEEKCVKRHSYEEEASRDTKIRKTE